MRLGFDLDGVVADLQGALRREAALLFPDLDAAAKAAISAQPPQSPSEEAVADVAEPEQTIARHALSSRQQAQLWRHVSGIENFWETLDELEAGSLRRLADLVLRRRWELLFLTSRPDSAGDAVQVQSHRWLERHGYRHPSVFVVHGSRGRIAGALGLELFVDDRPENCLDIVLESKARAILVWRGDEASVPASARRLGIGGVRGMGECLEILDEVGAASPAGLKERLKRALGLKQENAGTRAMPWMLDQGVAESDQPQTKLKSTSWL